MDIINSDIANYYELSFKPKNQLNIKSDNFIIYDTNLSFNDFQTYLFRMKNTTYKYFQKEYKEYLYDNITNQNYNNEEIKISKQNALTNKIININNNDIVIIGYQKIKQSVLNYPSTTKIYYSSYVKKMIFRINSRIFLNFSISLHNDNTKTYRVYLNYNHDNKVDLDISNKNITEIINILCEN